MLYFSQYSSSQYHIKYVETQFIVYSLCSFYVVSSDILVLCYYSQNTS